MFNAVSSRKATKIIIEQIRNAILEGKVVPGEKLHSEKELMEEFGVSKSTLREALRALEYLGLIEIRKGANGGVYATEMDMKITQENLTNQQGVVVNEINVNIHNQPYGGFPWLDMPQYANENWYNAHNFYGDLDDVKAATLEDVQAFFDTYYAPNNAVLVIAGDFESAEALELVKKHFGDISPAEQPELPDLTEPRQEQEKKFIKDDKLATRPALAFAYHMPDRNTPEYYAMGLIDQLLLQGEDSRLVQALVKKHGLTDEVSGGINALLGNMYNYNGPMLWTASLFHDNAVSSESILEILDEVVEDFKTDPVDQAILDRTLIKLRSDLYNTIGGMFGFGKADLLASFALFDDDPSKINDIEAQFKAVTPELIQRTSEEYLRRSNRTVLTINPKAES